MHPSFVVVAVVVNGGGVVVNLLQLFP